MKNIHTKKSHLTKVRSVGMALTMQGSGIAGIDTASIEIKLNDDGNYTLLTGSTDMGTGSDTILAQMCAEVLETTMDKIRSKLSRYRLICHMIQVLMHLVLLM